MMLNKEIKNLRVLWLAQTISQTGDAICQLALIGIISDYINMKTIFLFIGIGPSLCGLLGLSIISLRKL